MFKAIVKTPNCWLRKTADKKSERIDEIFMGWQVKIFSDVTGKYCKNDTVFVETDYNYKGFCALSDLTIIEEVGKNDFSCTDNIEKTDDPSLKLFLKKVIVAHKVVDILAKPEISATIITTVFKGSILHIFDTEKADEKGYVRVVLPDNLMGYLRKCYVDDFPNFKNRPNENTLRTNIVKQAMEYLNIQYRWGGKSPLGIDCSGLTFMAYFLNGINIFRDSKIENGFPIKEIEFSKIKKADLIYFPSHVALYIGNNEFIHQSIYNQSLQINSLDPRSENYNKRWSENIVAIGSIF